MYFNVYLLALFLGSKLCFIYFLHNLNEKFPVLLPHSNDVAVPHLGCRVHQETVIKQSMYACISKTPYKARAGTVLGLIHGSA